MRSIRLSVGTAIGSAALLFGAAVPSAAAAPPVQPGSPITMGGSYCTLNWIYDGTGSRDGVVYAGTAGHCVNRTGQAVHLADAALGDPIQKIGRVAYINKKLDTALIKLNSAARAQAKPAMAGHPNIPTGVATAKETNLGDVCQFSGHGVGFHATEVTQQRRVGVLASNNGKQHYCDGAVTPGDSGGPVGDVTAGNQALGIVNTVGVYTDGDIPAAGEGGVSMPAFLADARAHGFPVKLRTV
ncbi:MAG: trypsin-like serine protease [Streptosporangiales bacterium]|nr:trypsin-like serine protease [Streptosporangiales bacterium]